MLRVSDCVVLYMKIEEPAELGDHNPPARPLTPQDSYNCPSLPQ